MDFINQFNKKFEEFLTKNKLDKKSELSKCYIKGWDDSQAVIAKEIEDHALQFIIANSVRCLSDEQKTIVIQELISRISNSQDDFLINILNNKINNLILEEGCYYKINGTSKVLYWSGKFWMQPIKDSAGRNYCFVQKLHKQPKVKLVELFEPDVL